MEQPVSLGHNSAYETEIKATFQVAPISSLRFMCISLLLWGSPVRIVVDIGLDGKRDLSESQFASTYGTENNKQASLFLCNDCVSE